MNQEIIADSAACDALMELGFALGQSHTFGVLAGRCSAAQAQAIRRVREEKLYKRRCEKWDDFCSKYLKMSRSEADRTIKILEDCGPTYFELSQFTRISPLVYRAIAPAVSDGVLHHNGEAIGLTPENSQKVAAAVAEIRGALPKKTVEPANPQQDTQRRIRELARNCSESLAELSKISRDENLGVARIFLRNELTSLRQQMVCIGV
jgi:hypothetical protein